MSKRRRGWHQTANRMRRKLRHHGARSARPSIVRANDLKATILLRGLAAVDANADYDVHVACDSQLTQDGRQPPHDPTGKMDAGYHYNDLDGYLTGVRARLARKGRTFNFDHTFAVAHLSDQLIALEGAIVGKLA